MIHVAKWTLMYCRLCASPHTQGVCSQYCLLWNMSVNDVIWYDCKWCHMSFIWDTCMTSVWCKQCMQLEWYDLHVWCNMIHAVWELMIKMIYICYLGHFFPKWYRGRIGLHDAKWYHMSFIWSLCGFGKKWPIFREETTPFPLHPTEKSEGWRVRFHR